MEVVNKIKQTEEKISAEEAENKKLTYEQLNDACNQLWNQNQSLIKRNKELERFAMYKRLDYLFEVLNHSDKFPSDFVISCTDEIREGLTIVPEEEVKEEK